MACATSKVILKHTVFGTASLVHLIGRNSSIFLSIPTFISIAAGLETTYSWLKVRQMYQRFSRPPSIMVAQCTVWTTSCIVIYRGSTIVVRMNDLVTLLQHILLSGSEAESAKKRCWRKKGNSKRDKKNYGFRLFKGTEKWATSDFADCRQEILKLARYFFFERNGTLPQKHIFTSVWAWKSENYVFEAKNECKVQIAPRMSSMFLLEKR